MELLCKLEKNDKISKNKSLSDYTKEKKPNQEQKWKK